MNQTVAIVGGGPGGLTLARLLQQKGIAVQVYERDASEKVRVQGATLDLHVASGLRALEAAGLMDAFRMSYRPGADKLRIADKQGNLLFDEPMNDDDGALFRPEIDRGPLRDLLLASLQPGTVIWDRQLTALQRKAEGGWELTFQNGQTVMADVLIGADGARSVVRPLVTAVQPFYSGVTMVEGSVYQSAVTVPLLHQRLDGGKLFVLGDEKTLILSSKGDGSLVFYTGGKLAEDWWRGIDFGNKGEVLSWFRQAFQGWDDSWSALVEQATMPFVPRPQYCMPPDQHWEAQPDITLLGDAAHLMPPYAGEGVNMAMLDALELSLCLMGDHATTRQAIAVYEQEMRSRAGETARLTMDQTEILHSPGGLAHMLAMFDGLTE